MVVYHTRFGNTETIAKALASGMEEREIDVDCINVDVVRIDTLPEYALLAIGGPTHGFGISKPLRTFLEKLDHVNLRGKSAFAFDTKFGSRFAGSAAKGIEKRLRRLGMRIVKPYASAFVVGGKGPLQDGMDRTFTQIGIELARQIKDHPKHFEVYPLLEYSLPREVLLHDGPLLVENRYHVDPVMSVILGEKLLDAS